MKARLIAAGCGGVIGIIGGGFIGARMYFEGGAGIPASVIIAMGGALAGAFAGFLMGDRLLK